MIPITKTTPRTNPDKNMNPSTITRIQSTSLYLREGPSDKEYHAAIESHDDGHIVTFAYGRRGSTLARTSSSVPGRTRSSPGPSRETTRFTTA